MKNVFGALVVVLMILGLFGCENHTVSSIDSDIDTTSTSDTTATNEEEATGEGVELLFGMGNEIPMAQETPLFQEAPVNLISSWFSKPEDLEWMHYYPQRNTLSTLYGQGYAQELIIWLHDYPQYAISADFQKDLEELIKIFKGSGPNNGPLYVVLFTEYETYSDDPEYYQKLKDAFLESRGTIKGVYQDAQVAIGIGGYGWSGIEKRKFESWEEEAIEAGDFIAVQAHHHASNMDIMVPQVKNSIKQLGTYNKPIMMSHFRIWKRDGEGGMSTEEAFRAFITQMHTQEAMKMMAENGLFAWNFFWDDFINDRGPAYRAMRDVVEKFGTDKTSLPE